MLQLIASTKWYGFFKKDTELGLYFFINYFISKRQKCLSKLKENANCILKKSVPNSLLFNALHDTERHDYHYGALQTLNVLWIGIQTDHILPTKNQINIMSTAFSSKLGYEEHIPGQTRDWNEELQTTRELPRSTLPERLLRERAIFKVTSTRCIRSSYTLYARLRCS